MSYPILYFLLSILFAAVGVLQLVDSSKPKNMAWIGYDDDNRILMISMTEEIPTNSFLGDGLPKTKSGGPIHWQRQAFTNAVIKDDFGGTWK